MLAEASVASVAAGTSSMVFFRAFFRWRLWCWLRPLRQWERLFLKFNHKYMYEKVIMEYNLNSN